MSRTRIGISLIVILASCVPVAVAGYWWRTDIDERTREQYEQGLDQAVAAVGQRIAERMEADRRAIGHLCDPHPVIDQTMLDLEAGRFGPPSQERLVHDLPRLMDLPELDTLELVDLRPGARARVLAAGHFAGRAGARDPALVSAAEGATGHAFVRQVRVRDGGRARDARALLTHCVAARGDVRVLVVGGRFLDDAFVATLGGGSGTARVLLTDAGGNVPADVAAGGGQREIHVFTDESGRPAARLLAVVDDSALRSQLANLNQTLYVVGGVGVALALFFGLLMSMWLARPLRELAAAADRVAAGDLESTLGGGSGDTKSVKQAFNRMTQELKHTREKLLRAERIAAWRDIARRIAHEIKNPLSPIQVSIETMQKTKRKNHPDFDEIFDESTDTILTEVARMNRIVTEFSQFARMPRPKAEELSLSEVVTHVVGLHQGGAVDVKLAHEGDLPTIRADREQLTQVLVNLVKNGAEAARARHGDNGGRVHVELQPDGAHGGVWVRIQDNGPGIPADQRERIFEPYYTTKAGGTGLGLAIVHRIIGDHGGSIAVEDSSLGGAAFAVHLTEQGPPQEAAGSMTDTAMPLLPRS